MPLPNRVYADFECNNQPANESTGDPNGDPTRNDQKVLFKQIPIAVGFYLISPLGNQYYSYFGDDCVTSFVNEMLIVFASKYFETDLELEMTPQEEE